MVVSVIVRVLSIGRSVFRAWCGSAVDAVAAVDHDYLAGDVSC